MRVVGRRPAGWLATSMIVVGGSLAAEPLVDRLSGEWRQVELAVASDAAIPRYHHAVVAAYGVLVDEFEDAIVSYEVGALPTGTDGREIDRRQPAAAAAPTETRAPASDAPGAPVSGAPAPAHQGPIAAPAAPTTAPAAPSPFPESIIRIPKIGLSQAVVDGVSREHLKTGPGHYPGTALPGSNGNMVISGHRTTYTAPFFDLDLLEAGDVVVIDTPAGSYRYVAEASYVVSPDDVRLLAATDRPVLTLTTCTPKGSARSRLVVVAILDH